MRGELLHNLPAPRTALIGREREIEATRSLALHAGAFAVLRASFDLRAFAGVQF